MVGDIDEGPERAPQPYRDREGRLRVPGTMRLDELGQEFDLDLEHEEVDSVSGLVLTLPPAGRRGVRGRPRRLQLAVAAGSGGGRGGRRRGPCRVTIKREAIFGLGGGGDLGDPWRYSDLSAVTGSVRSARRAGTAAATTPAPAMTAAISAITQGSRGSTP